MEVYNVQLKKRVTILHLITYLKLEEFEKRLNFINYK